jgi:hypothetical protein
MKICKKLVKYLWTHHKLIVILTSLVLIILGYGEEGGYLIGIYLIVNNIVNRIRSPDETIDEIDDLIVLYTILERDRDSFNHFHDFHHFHHFHDSFNHSHHSHHF